MQFELTSTLDENPPGGDAEWIPAVVLHLTSQGYSGESRTISVSGLQPAARLVATRYRRSSP